jgi:RNase P subunit RPR2
MLNPKNKTPKSLNGRAVQIPSNIEHEHEKTIYIATCTDCGKVVISLTSDILHFCSVKLDSDDKTSNSTKSNSPSFITRVKNFAKASAKHIASGMPTATDEEISRRHNICMSCEFMKNNSCTKCGCPLIRDKKYISKLSWADSECPVGKWGKEKS